MNTRTGCGIALASCIVAGAAGIWYYMHDVTASNDGTSIDDVSRVWAGEWKGIATTSQEKTGLVLQIDEVDGVFKGSITLPDIGVSGWPVASLETTDDRLHVELPSDSGLQKIDLELSDGSLTGRWLEPGKTEPGIVTLTKSSQAEQIVEKRVLIDGPGGKIGASIIVPSQDEPFPAVVFLHGSGPQPRDSNRFAALRFADLGLGSVIYDKRGVGESEGDLSSATFEELAADAIAVAEYVLENENVSIAGFSGHSQGGWVSTLAAFLWPRSGFVISSAGPAVPPSREAQWTVVRALRNSGMDEEAVAEARAVIEHWHHGVRTNEWQLFDRAYASAGKRDWFQYSGLEYFSQRPSDEFIASYRAFMDYDPIPAIAALDVPYLSILSPDDESIDALETKEILESLDKPNIIIRMYPGYDHSMRRLGKDGSRLRWPEYPENYFSDQFKFIDSIHIQPRSLLIRPEATRTVATGSTGEHP